MDGRLWACACVTCGLVSVRDRAVTGCADVSLCGIRFAICSYAVCTQCAFDLGPCRWDRSIRRQQGIAVR